MKQPYVPPEAPLPVVNIGRIVCTVEDLAKNKYKLVVYDGDREHRSTCYTHHSEDKDRAGLFLFAVGILIHDLPYNAFKVEPACARARKEVASHVAQPVELTTLEGKVIRLHASF